MTLDIQKVDTQVKVVNCIKIGVKHIRTAIIVVLCVWVFGLMTFFTLKYMFSIQDPEDICKEQGGAWVQDIWGVYGCH